MITENNRDSEKYKEFSRYAGSERRAARNQARRKAEKKRNHTILAVVVLILAAAAAIPAKDENGNTDYAVHDGFNALWIALMALSTILTGRFRMN